MGTEKRERQKANRALRQQEIEKAESRRRGFRIAAIVIGGLVAVFGLVWIATVVTGDDDEATVTTEVVPDESLAPAVSEPFTEPVSTEPVSSEPVSSEPASTDQAVVDPVTTESVTSDAVSTEECPPEEGVTEAVQQFDSAPPMCLDPAATYQAIVTTNMGEFTIDLDQDAAPLTVNNFVFLARNLYYDDTPCHRIITDFVVQCGDPTGTGTGGPGYEFADELPEAGAVPARLDRDGQQRPRHERQPVLHHHRRAGRRPAAELLAVRSGHRRARHDGGRSRGDRVGVGRTDRAGADPVGPYRPVVTTSPADRGRRFSE